MIVSMTGKYRTRGGKPVRLLCVDADSDQPVVGMVGDSAEQWFINGAYRLGQEECSTDLIEVTPRAPSALAAAARKVVDHWHTQTTDVDFDAMMTALEAALKDEESK